MSNGLKTGKYVLGMEFKRQKAGEHGETLGRAKLYIDEKAVAEADMRTQPAFFTLCGEGLCVGRDSSDAVSQEYGAGVRVHGRHDPGVAVSVGDDQYVDLEKEAAAMMSRE